MNIGIFVGTVYGNALAVAEVAKMLFEQHHHNVQLFDEPTLSDWLPYSEGKGIVLVVTSSTGQGDFPDTIAPLFYELRDNVGFQPNLRYGFIALGDSSYAHFCGAGKQFQALLEEQGAIQLGTMLLIDGATTPAPEKFAQTWLMDWVAHLA